MNNFHELPQIKKEELDDLYKNNGEDELRETGFKHEFEDEIDEETAKLNEQALKEDEPYAVIANNIENKVSEEEKAKQKYELYNKAYGSSKDEYLGYVWAFSPRQALLRGHQKTFNMTDRTYSRATGIFSKSEKNKRK